jgi:capsular polysaccharide biosynthesis protein
MAYRRFRAILPWQWIPISSRTFGPPKGLHATTTDYLAVGGDPTRDRSHESHPATRLDWPLPKSVDSEVHWKFRDFDRHDLPAAEVHELHDVRFWGDYSGSVIGRDDRLIGDLTTDIWESTRHRIFTRWKLPPVRRLAGTTALLSVAEAERNYWHWTLEALPRFHALQRAGFDWADIDWFVINHRDAPFQRDTLAQLGIPPKKVIRADASVHLECERALVPSLKIHPYAMPPADARFLQDLAHTQFPDTTSTRRLYVSRANARFRRVLNENELLPILAEAEFEVVRNEEMSVAEQQKLFRGARVIAGPHGAGLTNAVYARPGGQFLEFMSPRYVDHYMRTQSLAAGLEHWVLMGEGPATTPEHDIEDREADMQIDPAKLRRTFIAMGLLPT